MFDKIFLNKRFGGSHFYAKRTYPKRLARNDRKFIFVIFFMSSQYSRRQMYYAKAQEVMRIFIEEKHTFIHYCLDRSNLHDLILPDVGILFKKKEKILISMEIDSRPKMKANHSTSKKKKKESDDDVLREYMYIFRKHEERELKKKRNEELNKAIETFKKKFDNKIIFHEGYRIRLDFFNSYKTIFGLSSLTEKQEEHFNKCWRRVLGKNIDMWTDAAKIVIYK